MFSKGLDTFEFVNSRDIKEHLKGIDYKFNSLETAWLIYQCNHLSIDEKHNAFKKLIETMPDCEVPKRMNTEPQNSLHTYLITYIATENEMLNKLIKDGKNYIFEWFHYDAKGGGWCPSNECFHTFEECFKDAIWFDSEYGLKRLGCEKFKIKKQKIGAIDAIDIYCLGEKVYDYELIGKEFDKYEMLYEVFDGLWFDFPTPFKKGDILCEYDIEGNETQGFCRGPFVVKDITPAHARENTYKYCDSSDMNAWGYFIDEKGKIYFEVMYNYMNLEFYRGDLNGKKRVLKALSNFITGQIDVALFSNTYHYILCDEHLKENKPQGYTKDGLELAGIEGITTDMKN